MNGKRIHAKGGYDGTGYYVKIPQPVNTAKKLKLAE